MSEMEDIAEMSKMNSRQVMESFRSKRIHTKLLSRLVMDYKARKSINPESRMGNNLGRLFIIIIDKQLGSKNWRGYSDDWKVEFKGKAFEHLCRYADRFDPMKCQDGEDGAFNYFYQITRRAFIQALKKQKRYTETNLLLNDSVGHEQNEWSGNQSGEVDIESISPDVENLDSGHTLTEI